MKAKNKKSIQKNKLNHIKYIFYVFIIVGMCILCGGCTSKKQKMIDALYYEYSGRYPDKGVWVDREKRNAFSAMTSASNSYKGTTGGTKKIRNEYLYKKDFEEYMDKLYFQSTMDEFGLIQEEYEGWGTYCYSDEKDI